MNLQLPTSVDEMTDILDIQEIVTLGWLHTLKIVGLILAGLIILALVLYFLYRLYKRYVRAHELTPTQRALRDLNDLKKRDWVEQRNWHGYYFVLDEIFRTYIQQQLAFDVLDKTYEEIHRGWDLFSALFTTTEQVRLDPFLARAQMIKFAHGIATPDEALGDFEFVEKFVKRMEIEGMRKEK